MIYLNHAGTSWPPPAPVREAVERALAAPITDWPESFARRHRALARWLGVSEESRLLLTPGCTSALSVAVADVPWQPGDRLITGSFEHHALARPVALLADRCELVTVPPGESGPFDLGVLERELERGARLVATAWATNVTGALSPVREIVRLAHAHGALVLLDAAQVGGWIDIDVEALGVDLLAFAGHKGPQAPWGIGGLYVAPHVTLNTPAALCEVGGPPCAPMPGYCDTGSVDRLALAGLVAGIEWLAARPDRLAQARHRIAQLSDALPPRALVVGPREVERKVPTLAFTLPERTPAEVALTLRGQRLLVAAGLLCAPRAHDTLGTAPDGVVRLSVGPQTTDAEIELASRALRSL